MENYSKYYKKELRKIKLQTMVFDSIKLLVTFYLFVGIEYLLGFEKTILMILAFIFLDLSKKDKCRC